MQDASVGATYSKLVTIALERRSPSREQAASGHSHQAGASHVLSRLSAVPNLLFSLSIPTCFTVRIDNPETKFGGVRLFMVGGASLTACECCFSNHKGIGLQRLLSEEL